MLLLPALCALRAEATDLENAFYQIELEQASRGKHPVTLLLERKNGNWSRAMLFSPHTPANDYGQFQWNPAVDVSGLALQGSTLSGTVSGELLGTGRQLSLTLQATLSGAELTGTHSGMDDAREVSGPLRGSCWPQVADDEVRRVLLQMHTPYPGYNNDTGHTRLSVVLGLEFDNGSLSHATLGGRTAFTWFGGTIPVEVPGADGEGRDRSFLFNPSTLSLRSAAAGSIQNSILSVRVPFETDQEWVLTGELWGNHFFGSYELHQNGSPTGHSNRAAGYVSWQEARSISSPPIPAIQEQAADPALLPLATAEGSSFAGPYFQSVTDYETRNLAHVNWLIQDPALAVFSVPLILSSGTGTGNKNYDNAPLNGSAAAVLGALRAKEEADPALKRRLLEEARSGGHFLTRRGRGPYSLPQYYKGDVWFAAWMGPAFLDLYDATGEQQWMDRALDFAETLKRLQQPSGTWTWVDEESGAIGISNERGDRSWDNLDLQFAEFLYFFGRLRSQYEVEDYIPVETAAANWLKHAVATDPVHNERNYLWLDRRPGEAKDAIGPTFYALYLLDYALQEDDAHLQEIIRIAEDEFITWNRTSNPGSDFLPRVNGFAPRDVGSSGGYGVDPAATMRMALVFLKLYQHTGKQIDLERAKALCESVLALQRSNGLIWGNPQLPDDPVAYTQQDGGHEYRMYYVDLAINLQRFHEEMLAIGQLDGRPWARASNIDVFDTDVDEQESVTLDGSGSQDIDGSIVSYSWEREDGTALGTGQTLQLSFGLGSHSLRLTVVDNDGKSGTTLFRVRVRTVPEPPEITSVSADSTEIGLGGFTNLHVSASDPNPLDVLSYTWEKLSGPGDLSFSDNGNPSSSTTEITFSSPGSYTVRVSAEDPEGLTATDTISLTATNEPHQGPFRFLRIETARIGTGAGKMHLADLRWVDTGVEYPTVNMTSNTQPVPLTVSQSFGDPGYELYDDGTHTWGYTGESIQTVTLDLGQGNYLSPTEAKLQVTSDTGRRPKHVAFYGSANGSDFSLLHDSRVLHPSGYPWQLNNAFPLNATPTPGVVVTETSGNSEVTEGGVEDSISVRLNSQPDDTVTVTLAPDSQVTANGSAVPIDLVFTASNWFTDQNVTVAAVDDATEEANPHAGAIALSVVSTDSDYNGTAIPSIPVSVTDDDGPIPPVAEAGADRIVVDEDDSGSEALSLDGSASSDPDGSIVRYVWTWTGGSASGVSPTVTLPLGTNTITLEVTDHDGAKATDTVNITVQGPGGGTGAHVEAGGLIVIEAEHFSTKPLNTDPSPWQAATTLQGFVGTGYVVSPETSGNKEWPETPAALTYPLSVSTAGTYTVWVRRNASGGSGNSFHLGLDGSLVIAGADNEGSDSGSWVWRNVGTVTLPAGSTVLEIRRREREGYGLDRIVLTKDGALTPEGDGPPESAREEAKAFDTFMDGFPSLNGPERLPEADPEGDGIINLLEFAFGLNAAQPDAAGMLPSETWTEMNGEQYLTLSYRRRRGGSGSTGVDYQVDGLQYQVQISPTLIPPDWQGGATRVQALGTPQDNGDGTEQVHVRMQVSAAALNQSFMRLQITEL